MTHNERGMTLVEVLIGSTLVALISIGMLTIVMFYARGSMRATSRQDADELSRLLYLTLSNESQCLRALRDAAVFAGADDELEAVYSTASDTDKIIEDDTRYRGNSSIFVRRIELKNARPGITPAPVRMEVFSNGTRTEQNLRRFFVNLEVDVVEYMPEFADTDSGNDPWGRVDVLETIRVPLKIYSDPAGIVFKCQLAAMDNQTCQALGGMYNHQSGACDFPICDATTAADPVWGAGDCPSPTSDMECIPWPPLYYWGHVREEVGDSTSLRCMCQTSCRRQQPNPAPTY